MFCNLQAITNSDLVEAVETMIRLTKTHNWDKTQCAFLDVLRLYAYAALQIYTLVTKQGSNGRISKDAWKNYGKQYKAIHNAKWNSLCVEAGLKNTVN